MSHFHRIVVRDLEDGAAWSESNSTIARRNSICQIVNVLVVVPIWYPWFMLTVFAAAIVAKGAVYKLVPSVFEEHGRALALDGSERHHWVRVMSVAFPDAAGDTRMLATESAIRETR